jgi:hypothetical protein
MPVRRADGEIAPPPFTTAGTFALAARFHVAAQKAFADNRCRRKKQT